MPSKDDAASGEESSAPEELTSDGLPSGLEVEREVIPDGAIRVPFDPSEIDVITHIAVQISGLTARWKAKSVGTTRG